MVRLSTGPCRGPPVQRRRQRLWSTTCSSASGRRLERIVKLMKILVALDGSRWAEAALPKAVELVKQNEGATIVVVRAVDPATQDGSVLTEAGVRAINEAADYLGNVAAQLRKDGVRP